LSFKSEREDFARKALLWIQTNLQQFDPTKGQVNRQLRLKALSELLFMCSLYKKRFNSLPAPYDEFVSFGQEIVLKMRYRDRIHRNPELVFPYSIIYKSLRECGLPIRDLKEVIQSMLNLGLPMAAEDNPYREMELRYALEGENYKSLPPDLLSLFQNTCFHRPLQDCPPVLSVKLDQVYGLTHIVFYLTDFGLSTRKVPMSASLRWLVSAQLGLQTLEKNWDAVAELLMCCSSLRYFPASIYQAAWRSLLKAQKKNGSLTDNFFDDKKFERMPAPERERYYFEQHYHTTTVSIAAAFLTEEECIERNDPLLITTMATRTTKKSSQQRHRDYADSLRRVHDWLLKTYADRSDTLGLPSLLYILMGEWIWFLSLDRHHRERLRFSCQQIQGDIARAIRDSPAAVDTCDPVLVLLAEGILLKFDLGIHEFHSLASRSADALRSDLSALDVDPRLFPASYLLESLGFELGGTKTSEKSVMTNRKRFLPEEDVLGLVDHISRVTSFGSIKFRAEGSGISNGIRANLVELTYHRLFHYNLEEALMLIRAMNHAGLTHCKPFEEAVMYVLAQQRDDGSFGFYADEIQRMRDSDSSFDSLQKVVLPTTVSAMWMISEAMQNGFSLFTSIEGTH
jgi:hypothetical protein